jgi:hypothetical protein
VLTCDSGDWIGVPTPQKNSQPASDRQFRWCLSKRSLGGFSPPFSGVVTSIHTLRGSASGEVSGSAADPSVATSQSSGPSPRYPQVNYVQERQMFSQSPADPSPYMTAPAPGESQPATCSIYERMLTQPSGAPPPQDAQAIFPGLCQETLWYGIGFFRACMVVTSPLLVLRFLICPTLQRDRLS